MIAAIYSRKSKFTEKGESVENQVKICKEYAFQHLKNVTDFIIYEDEGFSGKDVSRPSFKRMMKDAKNKKFEVIICYKLDRISRNTTDFFKLIEDLESLGINFISTTQQFDTTTPIGKVIMGMLIILAQFERETIAERVKDNMMELAKTGRWLGGTAPLGYKSESVEYTNEDGKGKKMFKLSEVVEEMEIVKLIYKLYLEKRGFASVATYLCKNKYIGKNSGEFSRRTVEQIVINPVYCIADEQIFDWFKKQGAIVYGTPDANHGLMVYNKREGGKKENPISEWIISVGKHEGVIHSDTWLQCQSIIQENKSKSSPRSGTGDKFLLSGMIICGECGSGMASWSHYNKKRDFMERYYRCNLKNRASNRCTNKMLNAYKAEEYIENYLLELDIDTLLKIYKENRTISVDKNNIENELSRLKKQFDENNKIHKGLIRKLALMEDDLEIMNDIKNEIVNIKSENNELHYKINELKNSIETVRDNEEFIENIKETLSNFKKFYKLVDIETQRLLIKSLVQNIVWYSKDEILEINPIISNKVIPQGAVRRRNI